MNKIFFLLSVWTMVSFADGIDLKEYQKTGSDRTPPPVVINPAFEEGVKGWNLKGKARVERGLGTVASGGLLIERPAPNDYSLSGQELKLAPGRVYNFSIMIRSEEVKDGDRRGATFAVEFSDKTGKWIRGGAYPNGLRGTADWTRVEVNNLKIPENAARTNVTLYLGKGCTGKAYYDDLIVTAADMNWSIYALNAPMGIIAPGKILRLALSKDGKSIMKAAAPGKMMLCGEFNGVRMDAPVADGETALRLPENAGGSGELKITVVDTDRKLILEEAAIPLTVKELAEPQPAASCRIDGQGYAVVDGRRFMPVGVYCNAQFSWELNKIRDAGFNTILPYNSLSMGFSKKEPGWERIGEVFDYCEKNNMKIIFSLKDVYRNAGKWAVLSIYGEPTPKAVAAKAAEMFRHRPGLLAYYTCDELPNQMIPEMTERRRLLNRVDPNHPVWIVGAIGYTTESMKPYGPAADIIGADPYPIKNNYSIKKMEDHLRKTAETGLPYWIVLQMFNCRRYSQSDPKAETFRFPSADEFRSMILLAAGYEARGYMFYAYDALCKPNPKLDGNTEDNQKTIKDGIGMLRKLEPFLLSGQPVKILPVNVRQGDIRAWEFSDGSGNRRIAVVALGPGPAEAEITVDRPEQFKSQYGKTLLKNGKLSFKADNIDSDLLSNDHTIKN